MPESKTAVIYADFGLLPILELILSDTVKPREKIAPNNLFAIVYDTNKLNPIPVKICQNFFTLRGLPPVRHAGLTEESLNGHKRFLRLIGGGCPSA